MDTQSIAVINAMVGLFGIIISYFQWRTAQSKVALEIFSVRFEIYSQLREIVSFFLRNAAFPDDQAIQFIQAQSRARFYFGAEVDAYLERVRRDMVSGDFINRYPQQLTQFGADEHVNRMDRLSNFYNEFDRMLIPYMRYNQKMPNWWLESCKNKLHALLGCLHPARWFGK